MLPRVNNPTGVPSADYLIDEETFCDLKTLTKEAKEKAIYNRVMHSVDQADTFIIDVTNYEYGEEIIDKQIDTIFWSRHTRTVNEIIIIRNMSVIRAERRKK